MDVEDADYMTDPNASLPRVSTAMMEMAAALIKRGKKTPPAPKAFMYKR